jgi:DNA repair protein RadC
MEESNAESSAAELSGIKSWAEEDRPREKFMLKGKHSLTESELIAILIRTGSRKKTAVDMAKALLQKVKNDLSALSKLSVADMLDFKIEGLGETKAITIAAALELGRRRESSDVKMKHKIISSKDAFEVLHPIVADKIHEEFWMLLLNQGNFVTDEIQISSGGLTGTIADVRMIFNYAIKGHATSVILCHNHPSGNLKPSQNDLLLTKKLKEAGQVLDISVHDHLIIGGSSFFSFADEGLI